MSEIYSITTKFFRMVKTNIKRSLLFTTIFRIGLFFERQWINSFFVKFYPNENFLSIIKKSKIISNSLFHPIIVIFAFSIFLILSLSPISTDLQINIAIGFITFVIGSTIIPKYFFNKKHEFINFKQDDVYSIGFCLFLVGIVFFFLSIASVGGIPLLKPSLRYSLKPILTMPVFLMIPGIAFIASSYLQDFKKKKINRSQIRFRFIVLIAISGFFLFALGYRTPTIAILLIMIIMGYYGKVLSIWEIVIGILLGIAMIIGIGYFRSLEEFMITKNTSPLYSLQSRADFTLHVLNLLNYISGDFGTLHGTLTLSSIPGSETGPRMLVGQLIAWRSEVTITPTLIGPMLIDFGKMGIAIGMGLFGFILGIGYKIIQITKNYFYIALYAILLAYTLLGIETGILDIHVIAYFVIGLVIYTLNILKTKT